MSHEQEERKKRLKLKGHRVNSGLHQPRAFHRELDDGVKDTMTYHD